MLALKTPVEVTQAGSSRPKPGIVVGRTRAENPRYDVLVNGQVLNNLPAEQVKPRP